MSSIKLKASFLCDVFDSLTHVLAFASGMSLFSV
jgi:hypothetical protein